eukprot:g44020.t1
MGDGGNAITHHIAQLVTSKKVVASKLTRVHVKSLKTTEWVKGDMEANICAMRVKMILPDNVTITLNVYAIGMCQVKENNISEFILYFCTREMVTAVHARRGKPVTKVKPDKRACDFVKAFRFPMVEGGIDCAHMVLNVPHVNGESDMRVSGRPAVGPHTLLCVICKVSNNVLRHMGHKGPHCLDAAAVHLLRKKKRCCVFLTVTSTRVVQSRSLVIVTP